MSPTTTAAIIAAASLATAAHAVTPFTETFDADAANWRQDDATTPLTWNATGGPDAGPHASTTFNFLTWAPGTTPAIIRGHDDFDASDDAFVGNWITTPASTLSFDIRHDAGVPLTIFTRVATSANFPGAGAIDFVPVPSGLWTTIAFDIEPGTWFLEGPFSFASVFAGVGNVQIGADPGALANVDQNVTFDIDNIAITPAPGVLTLAGIGALAALRRRR